MADFNSDGGPDVVIADATDGTFSTILGPSGSQSAGVAIVADAPLSATGIDHGAVVGATFFGAVAHFTDANRFGATTDFTATITWGDGQQSTGTIEAGLGGGFVVLGTHGYFSAGTDNVSVAIVDKDGSTVAAAGTIEVTSQTGAALSATGNTFTTTATVASSEVVARFTDSDSNGTVNDFTALIDWGDGEKSLGLVQSTSGGFDVTGVHAYGEPGKYDVKVSIFDAQGVTAVTASSADVVANATSPLAPIGLTLEAVEQAPFTSTVATFTDSDRDFQASDYVATILWGDGQTSAGSITANPGVPGQFDVAGAHTYAKEGVYAINVQIDRAGAATTANSTATIADAALTASGVPVSGTEAAAFTGIVASFSDTNPFGTLDGYAATIDWGDGHLSSGVITADPANFDHYNVTGTNTYAEAGQYVVTVTVSDLDGSTDQVRLLASVADAALTAKGMSLSAAIGTAFSGVVATFTGQNPASAASDFLATILWGDGRTTIGSVVADPSGGFDVNGTHTYADSGRFSVTISILDVGGATGAAQGSAVVAGPAVQASAVNLQTTEGLPFAGEIASFRVALAGFGPRDFAASIDWGNGQTSAGTVLYDASRNLFSVLGNMTYIEAGAYAAQITIGDRDGVLVTLNSSVTVADAALTATRTAIAAIEGVPFSGMVAHFTDANPSGQAGDFTAQITWGDGQTTSGIVAADPAVAGQFDVTGSVTYQTLGSLSVVVTITDMGGATAAVHETATVTVLPTASGATIQAQAEVPFSAKVASINDPNPGDQPSDYMATIVWGDGHTSAGLVTHDPNDAQVYDVLGTSAYTEAGTYTVVVSMGRTDGSTLSVTSAAVVSVAPDAALTALPGIAIDATQNVAVKALAAMFRDADTSSTLADYMATIHWGDGTSSSGTIVAIGGQAGLFGVAGQHTYA